MSDASMKPPLKLALLLTGNELMSGVTVDSNSSMIAQRLEPLNIQIACKSTIGDDPALLAHEIQRLASTHSVLIINGGLGPTDDDLTASILAQTVGVPLEQNTTALEWIENWCRRRGVAANDANRKQAWVPQGTRLIPNPSGSAPGIQLRYLDCEIICTPGVPSELSGMLDETILPWLDRHLPPREPVRISRFQTFGLGESHIQQTVRQRIPDWPSAIELGFRAGAPSLELKVSSFRSEDESLRLQCEQRILDLFGDYVFARGGMQLQHTLVQHLLNAGKHITTAESCTGGLIASMLTEVPGSSKVFEGGYVSYSNAMKVKMLGVSEITLEEHGAVSEAVVMEMANGALARSSADFAIAVSGIAGPDGGTPDKPVGTVWLAWGGVDTLQARQLYFPRERKLFQLMVAATALDLIRRALLAIPQPPRYLAERTLRASSLA